MRLFELFRRSPPETTLAALRDLLEVQNDRIRTLERSRKERELESESSYDKVHKVVQRPNTP